MRKPRKLSLARETLRRLEAHELGRVAGQQIGTGGSAFNCTDTSCTYFICEPSNPYPCNDTILTAANARLAPVN